MPNGNKLGSVIPQTTAFIRVNGCLVGNAYDAPNPIGKVLFEVNAKEGDKVNITCNTPYYSYEKDCTPDEIKSYLNRGKYYTGNLFEIDS